MDLSHVIGIVLLAVGFGFVIFWHELGHFLAAKWVGIKVEQFAVGFGQAIFAWRKGVGFRVGTTRPDYERKIVEHIHGAPVAEGELKDKAAAITPQQEMDAAAALKISETEYRLNWIPLGGYVKMLGQDDMNPNAQSPDPRSFNRKSIGARMLVVSAGVIMNIILAMIGFAIVFHAGFDAPPAVVGQVLAGSPAQKAGLEVGDRIVYIDDAYQHDFTKLQANIVLAGENSKLKTVVQHPDGTYETIALTPQRSSGDARGFLGIGVGPAFDLVGPADNPENRAAYEQAQQSPQLRDRDALTLAPGDVIVAVAGKRLQVTTPGDKFADDPAVREAYFTAKRRNLEQFDEALQTSNGKPLEITVRTADGQEETRTVKAGFARGVDGNTVRIAGMAMRSGIAMVNELSPVKGKVLPGDIVEEVSLATPASPAIQTPTMEKLTETLNGAGDRGEKVNLKLDRDGEIITVNGIETVTLESKKSGINVGLDMETDQAIVAAVDPSSAAGQAGIPRGAKITRINDTPVSSWFDVRAALMTANPGEPVAVLTAGNDKPYQMTLSDADIAGVRNIRLSHGLQLQSLSIPRQTDNAFKAMSWGVVETTSLLKQFYISLQRMVDGTISPKHMMGPVGIFNAGTDFAQRGNVWLIWFLCMISANLAVVNFLPIPIVDGGLFTFLVIEKIKGSPISAKAQTVAQIVGLALLGFVFVFATWQDIYRMIYGWG